MFKFQPLVSLDQAYQDWVVLGHKGYFATFIDELKFEGWLVI